MKLPSDSAIKRVIRAAKEAGLPIGAVDVSTNGVTIHPPHKEPSGSAYDRWKAKQGEARPAHN